MLNFAFSQRKKLSGSMINLGFAQRETVSGSLNFAFSQRQLLDMPLYISVAQANVARVFNGNEALGVQGDYGISIRVGNSDLDLCQLTEFIDITHGENEAYTCELTLQKRINPLSKTGTPFDPYRFYGKQITINVFHVGGAMRIYRGFVNSVEPDFVSGKVRISCSDRRQRMIDALRPETVRAIGLLPPNETFDNLSDELDKRLETVPASFEFDLNGNGYLNSWFPKKPTRRFDGCTIYYREPRAQLAKMHEVVNVVNVDISNSFARLRQRRLFYTMILGINVCEYSAFGKLPTVNDIADVVAQTGWELDSFDFERAAKSGWYNCPMGGRLGNLRPPDSADVVSGRFSIVKRWVQNVGIRYAVRYSNRASITRYGELSHNISFSTDSSGDAGDWTSSAKSVHDGGAKYDITTLDRIYHAASLNPTFPKTKFTAAPNGDWYADLKKENGDIEQLFHVAFHTARTKMLESHRQNTLDLEVKFLPELSLKHTHEIDFKHFSGSLKVAHFQHKIDVLNKIASTAIQYRFFQNGAGAVVADTPDIPKMPDTQWAKFFPEQVLNKKILEQNQDPQAHYGVLYQKGVKSHGLQLYTPLGVRLFVPEIEQQSTDTAEQVAKHEQEIFIPNTLIEMRF